MASIVRLSNAKQPPRAIDFSFDGQRRRIRLGIVDRREADRFKGRLESLISLRQLGQPVTGELADWLTALPDATHARLATVGLVEPRQAVTPTISLGTFADKYLAQRSPELRSASVQRLAQSIRRLRGHFGDDRPIDAISADDAADWRADLIGAGLAEATVRLHCRNAKALFNNAVERELLPRNPFAGLRSAAIAADREHYVASADIERVLAKLPNTSWRLLVGLARFAGLRCPSETHGLTWADFDWTKRRLHIRAVKTKTVRRVPIVPRLFELLESAFAEAEEGAVHPVTVTRSKGTIHRTVRQGIEEAGLEPWPDLMQALRRAAESDLAARFPQHAVSAWIGHSEAVSRRYYLQVTDELMDRAAGVESERAGTTESGPQRVAECAAVCCSTKPNGGVRGRRRPSRARSRSRAETLLFQEVASLCDAVQKRGGRDSNPQPPDRQSGTLTN